MALGKRPLWQVVTRTIVGTSVLVGAANALASVSPRLFAALIDSPTSSVSLASFALGSLPILDWLLVGAFLMLVFSIVLVQLIFGIQELKNDPEVGVAQAVLVVLAAGLTGVDMYVLVGRGSSRWVYAPWIIAAVWAGRRKARKIGWRRLLYIDEYARLWPSLWLLSLGTSAMLILGIWALARLRPKPEPSSIIDVFVVLVMLVPVAAVTLLAVAREHRWLRRFAISARTAFAVTTLVATGVVFAGSVTFAVAGAAELRQRGRVPAGSSSGLFLGTSAVSTSRGWTGPGRQASPPQPSTWGRHTAESVCSNQTENR